MLWYFVVLFGALGLLMVIRPQIIWKLLVRGTQASEQPAPSRALISQRIAGVGLILVAVYLGSTLVG